MIDVRLATLADAGELTRMRCAFLEELGQRLAGDFPGYLQGWVEAALQDGRLLAWLAVNGEGAAVGSAAVNPYPHLPSQGYPRGMGWYLLNVYVRPPRRRSGVASALLGAVGREARERGVDMVNLHYTLPARRLYERYGFRHSPDAMALYLG
jgi:GNAT superfamily N-acetyltransferase